MDAPLAGISQGYAGKFELSAANFEHHYDPELESIYCLLEDPTPPNWQLSVNHLYNVSSETCTTSGGAPQSECKLQQRVFKRSHSISLTYTPPPSGQVLQLELSPLPTPVVVVDTPPHSLPYFDFNTHQFGADPTIMDNQSHDPHGNFSFSFSPCSYSHVEAKHQYIMQNSMKLGPPLHHQYIMQNSMKLGPPRLNVPTSPIEYGTSSPMSPAYSTFSMAANSDSVAMGISTASAPAALPKSNSSFSRLSERASLSVPPSPTPSVNKRESTNEEMRSSPRGVAFNVKTNLLNLHDGYTWKKYGEKVIKRMKFSRSYFKCAGKDQCGCKVIKRAQRANDEKYIQFTYFGRHNHAP